MLLLTTANGSEWLHGEWEGKERVKTGHFLGKNWVFLGDKLEIVDVFVDNY